MDLSEMFSQAINWYHHGDMEGSAGMLEQIVSEAFARKEHIEFRARANLCEAFMRLGEYRKALTAATELLARARHENLEEFEGEAIGSLAMAIEKVDLRRRWDELKPLQIHGLDIARKYQSDYWMVQHPETLGRCCARMGEHEDAIRWLQVALNALHSHVPEESFFRSRVYQVFSFLARCRLDWREAQSYAEMALAVAGDRQKGFSPHLSAMATLELAQVRWGLGEKAEGVEMLENVLRLARDKRWLVEEQTGEYLCAVWYRELGLLEIAERAARRALELAEQMELKEERVMSMLMLGNCLLALNRQSEGVGALRFARRLAQESDYADHFANAESQLAHCGGA